MYKKALTIRWRHDIISMLEKQVGVVKVSSARLLRLTLAFRAKFIEKMNILTYHVQKENCRRSLFACEALFRPASKVADRIFSRRKLCLIP